LSVQQNEKTKGTSQEIGGMLSINDLNAQISAKIRSPMRIRPRTFSFALLFVNVAPFDPATWGQL
jgi:hypothetical protein